MWEKGGNGIRTWGNGLKCPELSFPTQCLWLWTPHMDLTQNFWKKLTGKCGKNQGKNYFPPFWFLNKKLDHNSGLHAKKNREISSNKVRRLLWPLRGGKCGKGGGNIYGEREMHYKIQNWVSRPNINDFRHPTWTFHKVFEKKWLENAGKIRGKIIFPHFGFWFKN